MTNSATINRDAAASRRLTEARARIARQRAQPPRPEGESETAAPPPSLLQRVFRRGRWENAAMLLIGLGVVMLMQPFALDLFTYSFVTILTGTVTFIIVSHFPE